MDRPMGFAAAQWRWESASAQDDPPLCVDCDNDSDTRGGADDGEPLCFGCASAREMERHVERFGECECADVHLGRECPDAGVGERLAEECVRREANLTRGDNSC